MSLISVSSESAEVWTIFRYSRCSRIQVGVQQQFGHAHDSVHGRADFVAHVGQELALGAIGGFGRFFRPLQICFGLLSARYVDVDPDDSAYIPLLIQNHALGSCQDA